MWVVHRVVSKARVAPKRCTRVTTRENPFSRAPCGAHVESRRHLHVPVGQFATACSSRHFASIVGRRPGDLICVGAVRIRTHPRMTLPCRQLCSAVDIKGPRAGTVRKEQQEEEEEEEEEAAAQDAAALSDGPDSDVPVRQPTGLATGIFSPLDGYDTNNFFDGGTVGIGGIGMTTQHDAAGWDGDGGLSTQDGVPNWERQALDEVRWRLEVQGVHVDEPNWRGLTALMECAIRGYHDAVRYLVEEGEANVEATNERGDTALMLAAAKGSLPVVQLLLEAKAQVDHRNEMGWTPFFSAAMHGHVEVMEVLAAAGANVRQTNNRGDTALHLAAMQRRELSVVFLVEMCKVDVNARNKRGQTALLLAAVKGHADIVAYLGEHGADAECADLEGDTAVHYAVLGKHFGVVEHLCLERRVIVARSNVHGNTPLTSASIAGSVELVCFLMELDNTITNHKNHRGNTALSAAALAGHEYIVRYLLENGADANGANKRGDSALMLASLRGHDSIVAALLEHGADVDHQDSKGNTALILAALQGHLRVVQLLVGGAGANVDHRNKRGETALMIAQKVKRKEVIPYLLEQGAPGAQINAYGDTLLHVAASRGDLETITKTLLKDPTALNCINLYGETPLMSAAKGRRLDVLRFLLDSYPELDVNATSVTGDTLLTLAARRGHAAAVEYLLLKLDSRFPDQQRRVVDTRHINKAGWSPLLLASKYGHAHILKLLVTHGKLDTMDINLQGPDGETALLFAAEGDAFHVVQSLVEHARADATIATKQGRTPLHAAARLGNVRIVRYLLREAKANAHATYANGDTPLSVAAAHGHVAVVRLLLDEARVNLHHVNDDGNSALMLAAMHGHTDVVRLLVGCGAIVSQENKFGQTAHALAVYKRKTETVDYFVWLAGTYR